MAGSLENRGKLRELIDKLQFDRRMIYRKNIRIDKRQVVMYVTSIKDYLLLDEVQFMSRFEEVLNSLLRISNIDVYVTGSNSKFLSSDIVTEFRGRGDEIRIYPLSFAEFYAAFDGDYDDAWEEYMIYGGLPQVLQFSVERQKAEYLKNIFTNVYIKDVVERNKLRNVDEIDTLVDWRLKHRYFWNSLLGIMLYIEMIIR